MKILSSHILFIVRLKYLSNNMCGSFKPAPSKLLPLNASVNSGFRVVITHRFLLPLDVL
jgi:hypothetical protein